MVADYAYARKLFLMKTTGWTVVTATGSMTFASKRKADKIAKELREGRTGARKHAAPVAAKVVAA